MEWAISALDTLFFRGPDPFTAGDSVFLQSLFPPTPRTVQGMVRTALLEEHCVDLGRFGRGGCDTCAALKTCPAGAAVGTPHSLGTLDLYGPHLLVERPGGATRVYRAPGDLRVHESGLPFRLELGPPVHCDRGYVRLPWGPRAVNGGSGDEQAQNTLRASLGEGVEWVTEDGLCSYLRGGVPAPDQIVGRDSLVVPEQRVGLALNAMRTADEGMLYSIELVRPRSNVRLGVRVEGAADALLRSGLGLRRLGGEGRLVEVTESSAPPLPSLDPLVREEIARTRRLRLVLLQPADFDGNWLPAEFKAPDDRNQVSYWQGCFPQFPTVSLKVFGSCGGPPVTIGGWSLAGNAALELRPCVPAATVYYCEVEDSASVDAVVNALHDSKIGHDTGIGFGHVVVGAWNDD